MTLVGNLEAMLIALQTWHITELPLAARRRLSDLLYGAHVLVEMQVTGTGFPRVKQACIVSKALAMMAAVDRDELRRAPATTKLHLEREMDRVERLLVALDDELPEMRAGVLALLRRGDRAP
ncbi:MAG: hypothetical protein J2P50_14090 [Hyphomicrobiaceae bacterium]|nr:hypothetical protein [Hyphomicrobiaceae bacterium]